VPRKIRGGLRVVVRKEDKTVDLDDVRCVIWQIVKIPHHCLALAKVLRHSIHAKHEGHNNVVVGRNFAHGGGVELVPTFGDGRPWEIKGSL
jgi:hypothetical protein